MSTIIDACTKELLAWVLSESLEIDFVLKTVEDAIAKHGIEMNTETMIHSDYAEKNTMPKNCRSFAA
jgi:transposase InsO family protein